MHGHLLPRPETAHPPALSDRESTVVVQKRKTLEADYCFLSTETAQCASHEYYCNTLQQNEKSSTRTPSASCQICYLKQSDIADVISSPHPPCLWSLCAASTSLVSTVSSAATLSASVESGCTKNGMDKVAKSISTAPQQQNLSIENVLVNQFDATLSTACMTNHLQTPQLTAPSVRELSCSGEKMRGSTENTLPRRNKTGGHIVRTIRRMRRSKQMKMFIVRDTRELRLVERAHVQEDS